MSLDLQVRRRLSVFIHDNLYEICQKQALVEEHAQDGAASVICQFPDDCVCIRWKLESPKLFPFLKENLAADGALVLQREDGTYEAHLMECKLTINQDTWGRAKRQMRWSLARLQSLAGVLGIRLTHVCCYTAYRHEQWEKGLKVPLGVVSPVDEEQAETIELLQQQGDWLNPEIELRGFDMPFLHRKVALDPRNGMAQVNLV